MNIAITINGEACLVNDTTTVAEIVEQLDAAPRGVAVALNEDVVPRSEWSHTHVSVGDRVEVLQATKGG